MPVCVLKRACEWVRQMIGYRVIIKVSSMLEGGKGYGNVYLFLIRVYPKVDLDILYESPGF